MNYGAHGDTGRHPHFHLVPKYRDGYEWGGVFEMNPGRTQLTAEEYADMTARIKAEPAGNRLFPPVFIAGFGPYN